MVAVDGPISSVIYNNFKDKPALPEYLTDLINTNKLYNQIVLRHSMNFTGKLLIKV